MFIKKITIAVTQSGIILILLNLNQQLAYSFIGPCLILFNSWYLPATSQGKHDNPLSHQIADDHRAVPSFPPKSSNSVPPTNENAFTLESFELSWTVLTGKK